MTDAAEANNNAALGRAVLLMTGTSVLVPIVGILTQPILARALGVEGRGQLAAALAPAMLTLAIATVGVPEALTYLLARRPSDARGALVVGSMLTACAGLLCCAAVYLARPFLSVGDEGLGALIMLAMALTMPVLLLGVVRGAARGLQLWTAVALDKVLGTLLRVGVLVILWVSGALTVAGAVIVTVLVPLAASFVYRSLLRPAPVREEDVSTSDSVGRSILFYGGRVWLGSVASMLIARTDQLLLAPLSNVETLGLYAVALTISDVPNVVMAAVADALTGVGSRGRDAEQVTRTSRCCLAAGVVSCGALAALVPFAVPIFFGEEFSAAVAPTWILILASLVYIPGLMAASGLSAWGRPGLRSAGMVVVLIFNVGVFIVMVQNFGIIGACWTAVLSMCILSFFMVNAGSRVMGVSRRSFVCIRLDDISYLYRVAAQKVKRGG